MATGQISNKQKVVRVCCSDFRWFVRDTEGNSFKLGTNPKYYFMGECSKGLHPDTIKKQFADKPRICQTYSEK